MKSATKAKKANTALKSATKAMKSATKTSVVAATKAMKAKKAKTAMKSATKAMKSATKTSVAAATKAEKASFSRRASRKWKSLNPRRCSDEGDEGPASLQRRGQCNDEGSAVWLPDVVLGWEPIVVGWFWAPSGRPKFKYVMIEKESA